MVRGKAYGGLHLLSAEPRDLSMQSGVGIGEADADHQLVQRPVGTVPLVVNLTNLRDRIATAGTGAVLRVSLLWAVMCLSLAVSSTGDGRPWWSLAPSVVAITAGLWLSRFRPLAAVLAVLTVSVLDWRLFVAVLFMGYHAGRRRPVTAGSLGGFAAVAAIGSIVQSLQGSDLYTMLVWLGGAIVLGLFPLLIGSSRRLRAELVISGWERAAQLEREQRIVAEQARLQERARIARDMHDSLGHELSLVALRAGALELAEGLEARHRAAASELRAGVATASERLGEIVGLLRDEADEVPLYPVDEQIEELVVRAAKSGVPVTLHVGGEYDDVAPMQYRAAYRVVQESLTNATKHAPGGSVSVSLGRVEDEIVVSVRNKASPHRATVSPMTGGRGLAGLRERVSLARGVLRAEPCDGGFEVEARIPANPDPDLVSAGEPEPARIGPGRREVSAGGWGAARVRGGEGGVSADGSGAARVRGGGRVSAGGRKSASQRPGRAQVSAGSEPLAVAPAYAAGFRDADRNARRGLVLALSVPSVLVAVLVGTLMLVYAHDSLTSRLAPADFRALQLGAGRDEVADRLPGRQVPERRDTAGPFPLPGATCEYYRSAAGFVPAPFDVYRLCFRDGRLVTKDVLPPPGG
ncbi:sensor histidine kinase [Couchioplanes caeruleus]|uniref:histidine kinase n=2 Tax=Couchioplanes caeruleus TaxID=56438 RepID=A0A1K0GLQ2_9ACTN|nr:histidine kinase [Couchioplanes caeruleus]OJF10115.1 hypothetical protein BG844_34020 [Couchioplanes caeruleus subsp. caeruleus]ROP29028.1 signal transduction histidine kinase [Couchioplanes caeruleus]